MKQYGIILDGVIRHQNPKQLGQWMLDNDGKDVICEYKVFRTTRSNKANAYYWGAVCSTMLAELKNRGYEEAEIDDCHEILKRKHLPKVERVNKITGELYKVDGSTAKLDTSEFFEYCEKCRVYVMETFECIIETPAEHFKMSEEHYDQWKMGNITHKQALDGIKL